MLRRLLQRPDFDDAGSDGLGPPRSEFNGFWQDNSLDDREASHRQGGAHEGAVRHLDPLRVVVAHLPRRLCDAHLDPGTEGWTWRRTRLGTPDSHGRPVKGTVAGVSGSHVSLGWHPLKRQFHLTDKDQRQLTTAIGSENPTTSLRKAGETEAPAEPPDICLARCFPRCPVRGRRNYPVNIPLRRFSHNPVTLPSADSAVRPTDPT